MERIKIVALDETVSTNRFLSEYTGEEGGLMTIVTAEHQTAGRGQGTNTWESERGKNLTFSIKICPANVPVRRQYVMLEAGALAVSDALSALVGDITIKWPNDIYWRDMKISGTLSECRIGSSGIKDCILGIGINVNQSEFRSDAPNPVSLFLIRGRETDRREVLDAVVNRFEHYLAMLADGRLDEIHSLYGERLYRREGVFRYADVGGEFAASIERVEDNGHLVLRREDGRLSSYAFKEVRFLIEK